MLAEAFAAAGCTYCDKDDVKEYLKGDEPDTLVLRRSIPHAGAWPGVPEIVTILEKHSYKAKMVYIFRDQLATKISATARNRKYPIKFEAIFFAIAELFIRYGGRLVSYEYFTHSKEYRRNILESYALNGNIEMEFYDGNEKYY